MGMSQIKDIARGGSIRLTVKKPTDAEAFASSMKYHRHRPMPLMKYSRRVFISTPMPKSSMFYEMWQESVVQAEWVSAVKPIRPTRWDLVV
jgi:hypothetical protein